MGIRSVLAPLLAKYIYRKQQAWSSRPQETQRQWLQYLLRKGTNTQIGRDMGLRPQMTYDEFKKRVPIRDYEGFRPYIDEMLLGKPDQLWPGLPYYFAKTSGTTSGIKYIPLTKESVPFHIQGARDTLFNYIYHTGKADFLDRKLIFLSGSPELQKKNGLNIGRLSGIVNHHIPSWLKGNQLPSFATNCIEDWETKLDAIVAETISEDMSLISGIPPWVQMYFDRITQRTGKSIAEVFPNFSLFVYGGVNFEPYRAKLYQSIGRSVPSLETYPASEGFIAFQDLPVSEGLLLLLNSGVFYEFVPLEEYHKPEPTRLRIHEVELNVQYAVVMTTNAGLWAYSIGDTVKFVSRNPYRLVVSGRVKHFISAFGEHVIAEEVEKAMQAAMLAFPETVVGEFTVAPQVSPAEGLPHHEWLIEFEHAPNSISAFARRLDEEMIKLNIYYKDLITGSILEPLRISALPPETFIRYMKTQGKLGGQNKVPRLSNDRQLAEGLLEWKA